MKSAAVELMRRAGLVPALDRSGLALGLLLWSSLLAAQVTAPSGPEYRRLDPQAAQIVAADPLPKVEVSPDEQWLLLAQFRGAPTIVELNEPRFKALTASVNARTGSPNFGYQLASGLQLQRVRDRKSWPIVGPSEYLTKPLWSPDSRSFVFGRQVDDRIEVWVGDVHTGGAHRVTQPSTIGIKSAQVPCVWMPDSVRLLCQFIPSDRGPLPQRSPETVGPIVEDSRDPGGPSGPGRQPARYLQDAYDELLLDYFLGSQLGLVDIRTGTIERIGTTGVYEFVLPSPDGRFILATRIVRPYSFSNRIENFPRQFEVIDLSDGHVQVLSRRSAAQPAVGLDWALGGARHYTWMPSERATLLYVETLDGGDPRVSAPHKDRILMMKAPFSTPIELLRSEGRLMAVPESRRFVAYPEYPNLAWLPGGELWVEEVLVDKRRKRIWRVDPRRAGGTRTRLLLEFDYEDSRQDPGIPMLVGGTEHTNPVLLAKHDFVYLAGQGAADGEQRPFVDRLNIQSGKRERVFASRPGACERGIFAFKDGTLLTRAEDPLTPPRYVIRSRTGTHDPPVAQAAAPPAQFRGISGQSIAYRRADGVQLNGILYLPPGYAAGTRVPTVIWAYPGSYATAEAASRRRLFTCEYIWSAERPVQLMSQLLLTAGYAVLSDAAMPVVGDERANDTAVSQFVANASAAVDKLVEMGVSDRSRIAIAGHSYGATMVTTLLANSDLFAAGIALSGAYNLTQIPGGFGYERRTLWQAREAYRQLSALERADAINAPLLLIHGENDLNPGSPVAEARRLFNSLRGLGKESRLVILPLEGHVPQARESIEHVSWEMARWLDAHLGPGTSGSSSATAR